MSAVCANLNAPHAATQRKRKPEAPLDGSVDVAIGGNVEGAGAGGAKRCRAAKTLAVAMERISDANKRLVEKGRLQLSTLPGSTVWSSARDAFMHRCVCGTELAVLQTKGLVRHGEKCKGSGPGGLAALPAASPGAQVQLELSAVGGVGGPSTFAGSVGRIKRLSDKTKVEVHSVQHLHRYRTFSMTALFAFARRQFCICYKRLWCRRGRRQRGMRPRLWWVAERCTVFQAKMVPARFPTAVVPQSYR